MDKVKSPIEIAREIYERKRLEAARRGEAHPPFEDTLIDHLRHGIVRSTTTCFAMAMPKQAHGQIVWMVRCAVGRLSDMITPSVPPVGLIAFTRNESSDLRFYSLERFRRLAQRLNNSTSQHSSCLS